MLDILCTTLLPNFHSINLQDSSYKHLHVFTGRMENSMDPEKQADLDLCCFQMDITRLIIAKVKNLDYSKIHTSSFHFNLLEFKS